MKIFLAILLAIAVQVNGIHRYNRHQFAGFQLCGTVDSLQTLWPDFDNNRIFHQCTAINRWGTHNCPEPLLFSFWHQVCVWERDWVAPPPSDVITPFPTTQWPSQSTTSQEITVPTTVPTVVPTTEPPTTEPPTTVPTLPTIPPPETTEPPETEIPTLPPQETTIDQEITIPIDPTDPNTPPLTVIYPTVIFL